MSLTPVKIGDCECCTRTEVTVLSVHGMDMCDECRGKQETAVKSLLEQSREIDTAIVLKADVFTAQTVSAIELRAAIEHDETIPADKKDYTFAQLAFERFTNLKKVIFEERAALLAKENEVRMWQTQVQNTAGKLRAELRAQFANLDISYAPTGITKKQKSTTPVQTPAAFKKQELIDACKKYNVADHKVHIRMMMVNRNLSADAAAKQFAESMGLL